MTKPKPSPNYTGAPVQLPTEGTLQLTYTAGKLLSPKQSLIPDAFPEETSETPQRSASATDASEQQPVTNGVVMKPGRALEIPNTRVENGRGAGSGSGERRRSHTPDGRANASGGSSEGGLGGLVYMLRSLGSPMQVKLRVLRVSPALAAPMRREQESAGRHIASTLSLEVSLVDLQRWYFVCTRRDYCLERSASLLARERRGRNLPLAAVFKASSKRVDYTTPVLGYVQMCEMVECLSRRTWLTDQQLRAVSGAFSDEVCTSANGFLVLWGSTGAGDRATSV